MYLKSDLADWQIFFFTQVQYETTRIPGHANIEAATKVHLAVACQPQCEVDAAR